MRRLLLIPLTLLLATPALAEVSFDAPKTWKATKPSSSMRKSQYEVGDAEVVVYYFGPNQGGTAEANIERWKKQFAQKKGDPTPEVKSTKHGPFDATVLDIQGTYSVPAFMGGGEQKPKEDWRMIAAVLETKEGRYFVRLIGPEKTVADKKAAFEKFLDSATE